MMKTFMNDRKMRALKEIRRRMETEQRAYRKKLLCCPPEKILELAPQYLVREQIIHEITNTGFFGYIENRYLYDDQIDALLRVKRPLAAVCSEFFSDIDLYGRYEHGDYVRKAIESCANDILRKEFLAQKEQKQNNEKTREKPNE